jgi:hypothetical protein
VFSDWFKKVQNAKDFSKASSVLNENPIFHIQHIEKPDAVPYAES